jgi:hypothetical protein
MVIANDRLQLDKFDRLYVKRVAVYEATQKILTQVASLKTIFEPTSSLRSTPNFYSMMPYIND